MSLPSDMYAALHALCDGRVYPDETPESATFPLIVYQQVGGQAYEYADQSLPAHDHARVQVVTWATTRLEADALARSVRQAILAYGFAAAETYGASTSIANNDAVPAIYGARQDFGIWHTP